MNTSSEPRYLPAIERWTLVCAVLVVGGAALLCGPRGQLGASLGAGLMVLNMALIRRLRGWLGRAFAGDGRSSVVALVILFNLKFLGLIVLIYLCIRYLPIDPVPFALGISILPLGILLGALQHGLRAGQAKAETDHKGDKDNTPRPAEGEASST